MPTTKTTFDRIADILVRDLDADRGKITTESKIIDDLGADSFDIVEITMSLEVEFDIELSDDEAERMQTVGDAVSVVDAAVAARFASA